MAKRRPTKKSDNVLKLDFGEANPKQAQFYASRTLYTAYGGARGGGKTHAVRIKAVGGALKFPGIKILIVRRIYPELQANHIDPILKMVPQTMASYNGALKQMNFINGSIIKFGHFQSDAAEMEYQGQEYDWIFIDEATQFTERQFRTLGGCLRGVNDIPKRMYLTCNPGGIGHRWVKRLFIDRDFHTGSDNPEENENPNDYSFIFASVDDNTHLLNSKGGESYKAMLSALPEHLRAAHRYGDWNALSGSDFGEFREEQHTCEPFPIPENWLRYRTVDYGLDMLACYWIAIDTKGRSWVYREFYQKGLIVSEAAAEIRGHTLPQELIQITFGPPDMWNRSRDSGKTSAEVFMRSGVPLVRADNNRVQGHLQIKEMLAPMQDGKPQLMIFKSCKHLIEDLPAIQADEKNPNDCAKIPHEVTHSIDALRYFSVSRKMITELAQEAEVEDDDFREEKYEDVMTGGAVTASYISY